MSETCAACGSAQVIPRVPLLDHYGDVGAFSKEATLEVAGSPEAWFFRDKVSGKVYAKVCGDCGHAELFVTNHRELYAKYAQSQGGTA